MLSFLIDFRDGFRNIVDLFPWDPPYSNALQLKRNIIKQFEQELTTGRGTQRQLPPKYIETLFRLFRSTFRSLEMHSKRRYKICTCSVILGELEPFRNYKGFNIIFSKNLEAIYAINESRNFSDCSLNHIFKSENFKFPFLYKRWPNLGSEMWKIKIQKVKGNLLEKLRKLYVHKRNGHLEIFSRP